ncbi:MAG TPA: rRNA maturation RNase YbeY [Hanamia sp.]|nr:rRNA maturation RNase YbeY [Hanamia sp.]
MGSIVFNYHNTTPPLKKKLLAKSAVARIFTEEKVPFKSLAYIFCTDEFLLKLNQEYLNHDTLTDILTFSLEGSSLPVVAEIYISLERVEENAAQLGVPLITELRRVMIHGVLHLCGYEDHTPTQKTLMRKKEDHYLNFF